MADNSDFKHFSESLIEMLKDKNVETYIINGKQCFLKKDALNAIIALCEESLKEGDCNKGIPNLDNLWKFKKANEIGFVLFDNVSKIDIVCHIC